MDQDHVVILVYFRSSLSIAVASAIVWYPQVTENIFSHAANALERRMFEGKSFTSLKLCKPGDAVLRVRKNGSILATLYFSSEAHV